MRPQVRLLALSLLTVQPHPLLAYSCIDYPAYLHWVGEVDSTVARDVVLVDGYGLVAGATSFDVMDMSTPASPRIVGSLGLPLWSDHLDVRGNYAYVANGSSGLRIIDFSQPTAPILVHTAHGYGDVEDVAVDGNYAYVLGSAYGTLLSVLDISEPDDPIFRGYVFAPGTPSTVSITGHYAYLAQLEAGIKVVDISLPDSPAIVASLDTQRACDVTFRGQHAFVADGGGGLLILDIARPADPVVVGSVITGATVNEAAVVDSFAVLASSGWGEQPSVLQTVDISNPSSPKLIESYPLRGWDLEAPGLALAGAHAYVACSRGGVQVFDVANPYPPPRAGSAPTPGVVYSVAISESHAFVCDGDFQVFDIADPSSPTLAGSLVVPGTAYDVAVAGRYAYVAAVRGGLQIIDVSQPSAPSIVGSAGVPGEAIGVAIYLDHAYVTTGAGTEVPAGLLVFDVSDPAAPVLVDSLITGNTERGVAIRGDKAYLVGWGPLYVLDLAEPGSPVVVGSLAEAANDAAISGSFLYMASPWLSIVDVSDPAHPALAARTLFTVHGESVAVEYPYVYVAAGYAGTHVVDVADPGSPVILGALDTPGYASCIASSRDLVCVGNWGRWLDVLPAQCTPEPAAPDPAGNATGAAPPRWPMLVAAPNPAPSAVTLTFSLPLAGQATLRIYDVAGRCVRNLQGGELRSGQQALTWDGRGDGGLRAARGVYLARLSWQGEPATARVLLLR